MWTAAAAGAGFPDLQSDILNHIGKLAVTWVWLWGKLRWGRGGFQGGWRGGEMARCGGGRSEWTYGRQQAAAGVCQREI